MKQQNEMNHTSLPPQLAEDILEYGSDEKKKIHKEKTRNRNQPYAFLGGGNFGEEMCIEMFPESIGSASKGGMAFDNKTINSNGELLSAKEVKFVSLVGTKICNTCKQKAPPFQIACCYCGKTEFTHKSDSRAGLSSGAHIKFKKYINEYIIFVQNCNSDGTEITLSCYKFLSSNTYFDNYIQNQYDSGNSKGGSCNFLPFSYDWYMSGPIKIMDLTIDISSDPVFTNIFYNPLETNICIDVADLKSVLTKDEKNILQIDNNTDKCIDYNLIVSKLTLRKKTIGKERGVVTRK